MKVYERRSGPVPATHTGICPICKKRRKVSPATERIALHGYRTPCGGRLHRPLPGSLRPVDAPAPAPRRICAAVWHAPGSDGEYPCNILGGVTVNRFAHKDPGIHRHTSNGLTIEWVDGTVSPTEQTGGPR